MVLTDVIFSVLKVEDDIEMAATLRRLQSLLELMANPSSDLQLDQTPPIAAPWVDEDIPTVRPETERGTFWQVEQGPLIQGHPTVSHQQRVTAGESGSSSNSVYNRRKRNPRCLRSCLKRGLLHPAQCHMLC